MLKDAICAVAVEKWELAIALDDNRKISPKPFADGRGPIPLPIGEPAAAVIEHFHTSGPPTLIRRLTTVAEMSDDASPSDWSPTQNYPHLFNSSIFLSFKVLRATVASALHIYKLFGPKVHTLVASSIIVGYHEVHWYGRGQQSQFVASGAHLYQLEVGSVELARKLLFLD